MALPDNIRIHSGGYVVHGRKGWENRTNFTIKITGEVQHPSDTMYIAEVHRDDGVSGVGSFALNEVYKAKDFATALNRTTADGGNICQLSNNDLVRLVKCLIKEMKEEYPSYRRELVKVAGLQIGTTSMIINPREVLDLENGEVRSIEDSPFIWMGKTSPRPESERQFRHPTSVQPLSNFMDLSMVVLGPKIFGVAAFAWAAMYMLNMYDWTVDNLKHFNLPVLFGKPMVGKTLIASCAAWLNGCPRTAIASRCTLPYVTVQVCNSTMPFVWDDPTTAEDVSQLAVDLGNAAVRGKIQEETKPPRTGCLVTANFDLSDMLKYFSRVLLLVVPNPNKKKESGAAARLEEKAHAASAAFPLVMKELRNINMEDVKNECKRLEHTAKFDFRIIEGIALNILVTRMILNLAGRYDLMKTVMDYVMEDLIPYYKAHLHAPDVTSIEDGERDLTEKEIDFKNATSDSVCLVKQGETIAFATNLIKDRKTCIQAGGMPNKTTRIKGRAKKMFHLPASTIKPTILEDLLKTIQPTQYDNIRPNHTINIQETITTQENIPPNHTINFQEATTIQTKQPTENKTLQPNHTINFQEATTTQTKQPTKNKTLQPNHTINSQEATTTQTKQPTKNKTLQPNHTINSQEATTTQTKQPTKNKTLQPNHTINFQEIFTSQTSTKQLPESKTIPPDHAIELKETQNKTITSPPRVHINLPDIKRKEKTKGKKRNKETLCLLTTRKTTKILCQICKREGRGGQKWVSCDGCGSWIHKSCANIDDVTFKKMEKSNIDWKCEFCI